MLDGECTIEEFMADLYARIKEEEEKEKNISSNVNES